MKLYTKQGDKGKTALFGGSVNSRCVSKNDPQVCCYGAIDCLNAQIGMVTSSTDCPTIIKQGLLKIQHRIFDMGAHVALSADASDTTKSRLPTPIGEKDVLLIEQWIDESEAALPALTTFILPGGHRDAAQMHVIRVTTRQLEGLIIGLHETPGNHLDLRFELQYSNRLSDLFFSWARWINHYHQIADVSWEKTQ